MDILDDLFKFPIVMADGDIEQKKKSKKERFGEMPNDSEIEEIEICIGEAECPCSYFIGLHDRWLPSDESFRKAQDSHFEACYVTFSTMGGYLVPWSKEKFKEEYKNFVNEYNRKRKEEEMEGRRSVTKQINPITFITTEQVKSNSDES